MLKKTDVVSALRSGAIKHVAAPMTGSSDLAFRMLVYGQLDLLPFHMYRRSHGAELCYTPMLHARAASLNPQYLTEHFATCDADRPLVVQACSLISILLSYSHSSARTVLLSSWQLHRRSRCERDVASRPQVQDRCDMVDINMCWPQKRAYSGWYVIVSRSFNSRTSRRIPSPRSRHGHVTGLWAQGGYPCARWD
jgi:hypothetical protein